MTTRRRFLSQALSLVASPMMPASAAHVIGSAVSASALPAAAAILSSMHVDAVAEVAVSAFDLNCVYEINPYPLFGDINELRQSEFAALEGHFTSARFDTLYPLIDALDDLPEDRRGYELDCLGYNIMQIYAQRLTHINHLLLYSDEHLQSLKTAPGFRDLIDAYHDEADPIWQLKAFGAQELRRDLLLAELQLTLECAVGLADKIVKLRGPEAGVPVTGAAYMAALIEWDAQSDFFMPERADEISSAEFSQCLKIWMERQFATRNQFCLGLYDVPETVRAELEALEKDLPSGAGEDRIANLRSALMAEEIFGSQALKDRYFSQRAVDPSLCRMVNQLAESCPGQQAHISWDDVDDPASAHFNIRIAGAGAQITREAIARLKEMFGGADIQVSEFPAETESEGQVIQIAYMDSQGQAEAFRWALAEALQQGERAYVPIRPVQANGSEPEPGNPGIPG